MVWNTLQANAEEKQKFLKLMGMKKVNSIFDKSLINLIE